MIEENRLLRRQLGERRLRLTDDNHQGLGNRLIVPPTEQSNHEGIACRERLVDMLKNYHRPAA